MSSVNRIDLTELDVDISHTLDMFYNNSLPALKTCEYLSHHTLKGKNGDMPVEIKLVMEVRQK